MTAYALLPGGKPPPRCPGCGQTHAPNQRAKVELKAGRMTDGRQEWLYRRSVEHVCEDCGARALLAALTSLGLAEAQS